MPVHIKCKYAIFVLESVWAPGAARQGPLESAQPIRIARNTVMNIDSVRQNHLICIL